ncbi:MAG: Wzz/FepE/Etk N-terminal domain-containing protein [Paracoccaceae bacterium]
MDVHSPIPTRTPTQLADADRVDVRGLFRAILGRRVMLIGLMLLFGVLFYLAASMMQPVYTAYSKVILAPRNVQVSQTDAVVSSVEVTEPEIFSEMSVMRSNTLLGDLIDQIGLNRLESLYYDQPRVDNSRENRVASLIDAIRDNLRVQREAESFVVMIRFDGRDAELVAALANGIADTYIDKSLTARRESVRQATIWIEELVAEAQLDVQRTETALTRARALSLQTEGSSYDNANQQLGNLTSELAVARAGLAAAKATYDQLEAVLERDGAQGLAMAVTSPLLETLLADRLEAQRKDDEWARSFGPEHPQRVRLQGEIEGSTPSSNSKRAG